MKYPIVLMHGMCCTGQIWTSYRNYFEQRGAQVFTPTLSPGLRVRGRVPRELAELRLRDYEDELGAELARVEAECGQKPVLIGHSMGGLLAQRMAERNVVAAAVLLSPTTPVGSRDLWTWFVWMWMRLLALLRLMPRIIVAPARLTALMVLNAADRAANARAQPLFVAESGRAFVDFATASIDETKIKVPVLTVAAGKDRVVSSHLTLKTGKKYEAVGGDTLNYPHHGHWMFDEPGWEKAADDIHAWLEKRLSL